MPQISGVQYILTEYTVECCTYKPYMHARLLLSLLNYDGIICISYSNCLIIKSGTIIETQTTINIFVDHYKV